MPFATTRDNVRLHYEEAGSGTPLLFVHEFAGDWRAGSRRCATSRGAIAASPSRSAAITPPTCRPIRRPTATSISATTRSRCSIISRSTRRTSVGLSMGGYATLCVGMKYPQRALSLTLAGTGSGSERGCTEEFRKAAERPRRNTTRSAPTGVAKTYGMGPARVPFEVKDPRGYQEFYDQFASHVGEGRRQHAARLSDRAAADLRLRGGHQEDRAADADRLRRRGRSVHRAEHLSEEAHRGVRPRDVSEERPHGEHRGARAVQPDARRISSRTSMRAAGASATSARSGRRRNSRCRDSRSRSRGAFRARGLHLNGAPHLE